MSTNSSTTELGIWFITCKSKLLWDIGAANFDVTTFSLVFGWLDPVANYQETEPSTKQPNKICKVAITLASNLGNY